MSGTAKKDNAESDNQKLIENRDYYFDPAGLMVLTEYYLLKRGFCCENGCKHCPYEFNKQSSKSET